MKVMLRAYPGIHAGFADISESTIGNYANIPADAVRKVLEAAQKENILIYEPRKEKPQLTFTRERVAAEHLSIDQKLFGFRKNRAEERMEQAIRYAETIRCRSRQLLAYFAEPDSPACGICDVCTGRNKSDLPLELFESLERKIREVLRDGPLAPEEIMEAFALKRRENVAQVIGYLLDENKLEQNEDGNLSFSDRS